MVLTTLSNFCLSEQFFWELLDLEHTSSTMKSTISYKNSIDLCNFLNVSAAYCLILGRVIGWYKIYRSKQWFLVFARACIWVIFVFNQTRGKMRVWYFFSHKSHNEEGATFFYLSFLKKSGSCLKVSLSHLKLSEFRWIWQRQWRDWIHVTCCSRQLLSSFWRWEKLFVVLTTSSNFGLYEQFIGNF